MIVTHRALLALMLTLSLALWGGCSPASLDLNDDDDDASGDDDDASGDDDASDDDASDDDTGDDDVSDDDTGDDDASDDDVSDDDDDDHLQCGPYVPPPAGQESRVYSGDGVLQISNDWYWVGCEVLRYFDTNGQLDCELLWEVEGYYYDWDEGAMEARYYLEFTVDSVNSTCTIGENDWEQIWYYRTIFDWDHDEMDIYYDHEEWGDGSFWSVANIVDNGNTAPFDYISGVFTN